VTRPLPESSFQGSNLQSPDVMEPRFAGRLTAYEQLRFVRDDCLVTPPIFHRR